jgi:lysozyme family protein
LEGGWNPDDPSMFGVSLNKFKEYRALILGDEDTGRQDSVFLEWLKQLNKDGASTIYFVMFWQRYYLSLFPAPLDLIMLVQLVHRETEAVKILQECLRVVVDGVIGPKTMAAIHYETTDMNRNPSNLYVGNISSSFLRKMAVYYEEHYPPGHVKHGNLPGYLARVEKLREEAGL